MYMINDPMTKRREYKRNEEGKLLEQASNGLN